MVKLQYPYLLEKLIVISLGIIGIEGIVALSEKRKKILSGLAVHSTLKLKNVTILTPTIKGFTFYSSIESSGGYSRDGQWSFNFWSFHLLPLLGKGTLSMVNMRKLCQPLSKCKDLNCNMMHNDYDAQKNPREFLTKCTGGISFLGLQSSVLVEDAEILFNQKLESGIKPDSIAFIEILSGFSHKVMVEVGLKYFEKMTEEYRIQPTLEHCSCMVDLLGRTGKLKDPSNAGWYVLMSNIYANPKHWDGVAKMRMLIRERKASKNPGWSSIDIEVKVHCFIVFDRSHPSSMEIYEFLKDSMRG
ncbi:Putative pentatricopeptide repeat-containing protein [Apostasia shenzhenica]|uniref:Pentatricopeptide repeat-containing protein n=1 Tax=Apostasia shenzhenica TaxID=1088818 RepID=A0A2I0A5W2_9ASPA|nr:Putative pentatricopeptide repeat-containing protein [Apostasia shenzhenica]